jgi:hypothetical protein
VSTPRSIAGLPSTSFSVMFSIKIGSLEPSSRRRISLSLSASKRETIVTGWGEHGAVRDHEWVYIGRWSPGPKFEELYNVRTDPKELKNVATDNPGVVAEYRGRLKDHVDWGWDITRGTFATKL